MDSDLPMQYRCGLESLESCGMDICSRPGCRIEALRRQYIREQNIAGEELEELERRKELLVARIARNEREFKKKLAEYYDALAQEVLP